MHFLSSASVTDLILGSEPLIIIIGVITNRRAAYAHTPDMFEFCHTSTAAARL